MKTLEVVCDCQLFKRTTKGVSLTEEGEILLRVARSIKQDSGSFHHALANRQKSRTLKLATHEVIIPLILESLSPVPKTELTFNIFTDPSVRQNIARLSNYEVDVAVVASGAKFPNIQSTVLFRDHYRLFCSKEFLSQNRAQVKFGMSLQELSRLPLILTPQVLSNQDITFEESFRNQDIRFSPRHVVESLETVAALVSRGHGIGILPEKVGSFLNPKKPVLFPVKVSGLPDLGFIEFSFCCRSESWKKDPLVMEFFKCLKT